MVKKHNETVAMDGEEEEGEEGEVIRREKRKEKASIQ